MTLFRRIRQRRSSRRISTLRMDETSNAPSKKKNEILFPWWCLFIAYGFSYVVIIMSIVLVIARGIEFGETKTNKWLTSMIIGLCSSILLSQPIKVCLDRTVFIYFL